MGNVSKSDLKKDFITHKLIRSKIWSNFTVFDENNDSLC